MDKVRDENTIIQNMVDAGCNSQEVECFCKCKKQGKKKEELDILERHREELLQNIHHIKNSIEELDQMIIKVKGGQIF